MTTTAIQTHSNVNAPSSRPFFNMNREGAFFSPSMEDKKPFFSPYWQNGESTALQLMAPSNSVQRSSRPSPTHSLEDLYEEGSVDLHKLALEKHRLFEKQDTVAVTKEQAALTLIFIFNILQERSNKYRFSYSLGEEPQNSNAEIWKIYGGFGDPLMGDLKSVYPFNHIHTWKSKISSWGKDLMHEAYIGKGKRNQARFTNYDMTADQAEQAYAGVYPVSPTEKGTSRDPNKQFSPMKGSSEWNSKAIPNPNFEMSVDQLIGVLTKFYPQGVWHHKEQKNFPFQNFTNILEGYLSNIKKAFKQAKIDTIQSQAAYLAHGVGEMQFAILTEGQTNFFNNDPEKNIYSRDTSGPLGYASDGHSDMKRSHRSVDPLGEIDKFKTLKAEEQTDQALRTALDKTFIGRGPIQVTHDFGYAKTLFYLQKLAESATDVQTRNELWQAVYAIKKDPSAVGKPEYAFLFSAAYMHATGGVRSTSGLPQSIAEINPGQVFTSQSGKKKGATPQQKALLDWVAGEEHNYLRGATQGAQSLGGSVFGKANIKIKAYNEFFKAILAIKLASKP